MFKKICHILFLVYPFVLIALLYVLIGALGVSIVAEYGKLIGLTITIVLLCVPTIMIFNIIDIIRLTR